MIKTQWYRREFVPGTLFALFADKSDPARSIIATKSDPVGSLYTRIKF